MGLAEGLTLLFIALQLTGYVNWSWLWVLSPLWITYSLILLFIFNKLLDIPVLSTENWIENKLVNFMKKLKN